MQEKFDDMSNNLIGKIDDMGISLFKRLINWWYWKVIKWYDKTNWYRRLILIEWKWRKWGR